MRVLIRRLLLERLLPRPRIPLQRARDTVDPVLTSPTWWHDMGKGIPGRRYGDIVSRFQLDPS